MALPPLKALLRLPATLLAMVLTGCAAVGSAPPAWQEARQAFTARAQRSSATLVRLRPSSAVAAFAARHGLRHLGAIGLGIHRFSAAELSTVARDPAVLWAEPDMPVSLPPLSGRDVSTAGLRPTALSGPDDPLLPAQYAFTLMGGDRTWRRQPGSPAVVVAVIDSGIDAAHPDLAGQALTGWDLTEKVPGPGGLEDGYGHGTHVAGVIAAKANNTTGIAGLAPGCKLLPVRIFNRFGHSSAGASTAGIVWAVDHGAKVINCSWGSPMQSEAMTTALRYAADRDVVVVAAAGNSGNNEPKYPGAEELAVGVAASTDIDGWASFSTFGDWVDLAAPGEGILSTYPVALGTGYRIMRGTSMAAPHVAAAAALLRSEHPGWTREQVIDRLYATARDTVQTGKDPYAGHGRVDVAKALGLAPAR